MAQPNERRRRGVGEVDQPQAPPAPRSSGSFAPPASPQSRATTPRSPSPRIRSSSPRRSRSSRPTSAISSRWSRRPPKSLRGPASATHRRPSSPTPATGTRSRWSGVVDRGIQVLVPPDSGVRKGTRPGWDKGIYALMRRVLEAEHGQAIYRRRMAAAEPVLGQLKFKRGFTRFLRRGR
jgi:hypothetical protein